MARSNLVLYGFERKKLKNAFFVVFVFCNINAFNLNPYEILEVKVL